VPERAALLKPRRGGSPLHGRPWSSYQGSFGHGEVAGVPWLPRLLVEAKKAHGIVVEDIPLLLLG